MRQINDLPEFDMFVKYTRPCGLRALDASKSSARASDCISLAKLNAHFINLLMEDNYSCIKKNFTDQLKGV